MKQFQRLFLLTLAALLATSCVTINVYFPAGAAEEAADQIIDSVIKGAVPPRSAPAAAPPAAAPPPGARANPPSRREPRSVVALALEAVIPVAHAQPVANIDVSSPEIRAITASMQTRFPSLQQFLNSGVIGLTADGLIDVRDISLAALPDRPLVRRLVGEDNADRNALYAAIARANNRPDWEVDIRQTFAQRWVERAAQPGWYFRDGDGNWKQR